MVPAQTTSTEASESRPPDGARKATLRCPECDHQSPPAGDWVCRSVGDREIRRCPECETVVERRPVFGDRPSGGVDTLSRLSAAARSAVVRTAAAWRAAVSAPVRAVTVALGGR